MSLSPAKRAELANERLPQIRKLMEACSLCPRHCGSKRFDDETGECGTGPNLRISQVGLHHGEEPLLSGTGGSGTVFLSGCNLACLFCQNYDISQLRFGAETDPESLAVNLLRLQRIGAHNINFVTPTPQLPGLVETLSIAWKQGLDLPIVYNCGGYESPAAIRLLDGLVDIYLTDFKYGNDDAGTLSGIDDYVTQAVKSLRLMWEQVGEVVTDEVGVARSGVIIRHLVLPNNSAASDEVLHTIAESIGTSVFLSLMSQYHAAWKAREHPHLDRRVSRDEYQRVLDLKTDLGFSSGYDQPAPFSIFT